MASGQGMRLNAVQGAAQNSPKFAGEGGNLQTFKSFSSSGRSFGDWVGFEFRCVEKNWPRQDREQIGKERQPRNEVLGIHWAQTAQFELNSSLERKHNRKNEVFSTLLLFYQHNNNTRYLCFR